VSSPPAHRPVPPALTSPALRRLFDEARRALENRGEEGARVITLKAVSDAEREAIADLHGWRELPPVEAPLRVDLRKLDAALRQSAAAMGLVQLVERLSGPLHDLRARRETERSEREAFWRWLCGHPVVQGRPELERWAEELRATGLVGRLAAAAGRSERELVERTLATVARLPAAGRTLAVLAAEVLGDAHALDAGQPETALVLRAAALLTGRTGVPDGAAERRRLWSEVGVACDTLSSDVLTLGLRPEGEGWLARHLGESSAAGEPRRVTLREVQGHPVRLVPGTVVFVCENPSIVQLAADRLGTGCAPLVCLEGHPTTAAIQLLQGFATSGAKVRVHTDFDWAGIRIANQVLEHVPGAAAWQMSRHHYEDAAGRSDDHGVPLVGTAVPASWDAQLSDALATRGRGILEEHVVEDLLAALA
jgi:uncharacterized protein (TIGR02679 family)